MTRGKKPVTAHHARNNEPRDADITSVSGVAFHMKTGIKNLIQLSIVITVLIGIRFLHVPKPTTPETQEHSPVATRALQPKPRPRAQPPIENPMDNEFYRIIVDNNLFRPLGWKPPAKNKTTYRLLGTLTNSERSARAILQNKTSQRTYTVSIGETFGDFQVTEIQPRRVTLKKGNQHVRLSLDNTLLINPRSR